MENKINETVAPIRCNCGNAQLDATGQGEPCSETDPTVTIETMPVSIRASHEAAGNSGRYPHNGAKRHLVTEWCADALIEADPDWTSVVS